jgi:hypothetical protein
LKLYKQNKIEEILEYCSSDNRPKLKKLIEQLTPKTGDDSHREGLISPAEKAKNDLITLLR